MLTLLCAVGAFSSPPRAVLKPQQSGIRLTPLKAPCQSHQDLFSDTVHPTLPSYVSGCVSFADFVYCCWFVCLLVCFLKCWSLSLSLSILSFLTFPFLPGWLHLFCAFIQHPNADGPQIVSPEPRIKYSMTNLTYLLRHSWNSSKSTCTKLNWCNTLIAVFFYAVCQ